VTAQSYGPSYADPHGTQLVAVYLGAASCGPCRLPATRAAIDSIKVHLAQRARLRGQQFRAVIVSMDWEPDSGLAVARESGGWDEMILGRNWSNLGAEHYIWADTATAPSLPQIIVYEQEITMTARVVFGPRRVLRRVHGADALVRWASQGAPLSASTVLPN
jgi:hypothetical protein